MKEIVSDLAAYMHCDTHSWAVASEALVKQGKALGLGEGGELHNEGKAGKDIEATIL